ncbi:MAG: CopG family transcriptional regulator [Campylobacteraceae bacterium]|nr:CopG family transcriptional regulator [Campylobacteraceae bacterium]
MKSMPLLKPKKLTFTLSEQSYAILKNLSKSLGKSRKEVAKEALEAYLEHLHKGKNNAND